MPGPPRTPNEILTARGSWLAKDRAEAAPQDELAAPEMPAGLSKEARQHWQYIVPRLLTRRTISTSDVGHLVGMCMWWGEFTRAGAAVAKLAKKPFKGHLIDHPRVVMRSAWEQYSKAAARFGLTPADKSRVQAAPEEKKPEKKPAVPVLRIAR
jgi:P27 family predicted phage terminase small subunit